MSSAPEKVHTQRKRSPSQAELQEFAISNNFQETGEESYNKKTDDDGINDGDEITAQYDITSLSEYDQYIPVRTE